jgi:hypothetical protein
VTTLHIGPILGHLKACPICATYTATHAATGTKADYEGLCSEGAELLRRLDREMDAQGWEPIPEPVRPS